MCNAHRHKITKREIGGNREALEKAKEPMIEKWRSATTNDNNANNRDLSVERASFWWLIRNSNRLIMISQQLFGSPFRRTSFGFGLLLKRGWRLEAKRKNWTKIRSGDLRDEWLWASAEMINHVDFSVIGVNDKSNSAIRLGFRPNGEVAAEAHGHSVNLSRHTCTFDFWLYTGFSGRSLKGRVRERE